MKLFKSIITLTLAMFALAASAQSGQKPKVILFPSDDWCIKRGYVVPGTTTPDYERALRDPDMDGAIAVLGGYMAEMEYPMFSLARELKQLHTEGAYKSVITSNNDGYIEEDDRDAITRNVGADFIVELTVDKGTQGLKEVYNFKVQTIDAASKKILHGDLGTSSSSSGPSNVLLKQAVTMFIEDFCHKLDIAFSDLERNGREGSVTFNIAEDCPLNFESTVHVNGESGKLAEYIEYWLEENTVNGSPNPTQRTRQTLAFDQVRFPLVGKVAKGGFGSKKGHVKSLTMDSFIRAIERDLAPMGISVTVQPIGQGYAFVVLGAAN